MSKKSTKNSKRASVHIQSLSFVQEQSNLESETFSNSNKFGSLRKFFSKPPSKVSSTVTTPGTTTPNKNKLDDKLDNRLDSSTLFTKLEQVATERNSSKKNKVHVSSIFNREKTIKIDHKDEIKEENLNQLISCLTKNDNSRETLNSINNLLEKCINQNLKGNIACSSNGQNILDIIINLSREEGNSHLIKIPNAKGKIDSIIDKVNKQLLNTVDVQGNNYLHKLILSKVDRKEALYQSFISKMSVDSLSSKSHEHGTVLNLLAKDAQAQVNINLLKKKFDEGKILIQPLYSVIDNNNNTVLHELASNVNQNDNLKLLILEVISAMGKNQDNSLFIKNNLGNTVLHILAKNNSAINFDIIKELIAQMQNSNDGIAAIKALNKDGLNFLHVAAANGHSEFFDRRIIDQLIQIRPDITKDLIFKMTEPSDYNDAAYNILQLAIINSKDEVVDRLFETIDHQKLVHQSKDGFLIDDNGNTILHLALQKNTHLHTEKIVDKIVKKYPNMVTIANNDKMMPLHLVAKLPAYGSLLKAIESSNNSLNDTALFAKDQEGLTPLNHAINNDQGFTIEYFLERADKRINELMKESIINSENILQLAYNQNKPAAVKVLLNSDYDNYLLNGITEYNILHKALEESKGELAKAIIESKAAELLINEDKQSKTVNQFDRQGNTILHKVLSVPHTDYTDDIVKILLKRYPELSNISNNTPLGNKQYPIHLIITQPDSNFNAKKQLIEIFTKTKAKAIENLNKTDELGQTILDLAVKNGDADLVKFVLKLSFEINSDKNQYILHKAVHESRPSIVAEICKLKSELINKRDESDKSPLDLALEKYARNKDNEFIQNIILNLIEPNSYKFNDKQQTNKRLLLDFIIDKGDPNLLKNILNKYPKLINIKDKDTGNNLMHTAIAKGKDSIITTLFEFNKDLGDETNKADFRPLALAEGKAGSKAAQILINCYEDSDTKSAHQEYYSQAIHNQILKQTQNLMSSAYISLIAASTDEESTDYGLMPSPVMETIDINDNIYKPSNIIKLFHNYLIKYDTLLLDAKENIDRTDELTMLRQVSDKIQLAENIAILIAHPSQELSLVITAIADQTKASIVHVNTSNQHCYSNKLVSEIISIIYEKMTKNDVCTTGTWANIPIPQNIDEKGAILVFAAKSIVQNFYKVDNIINDFTKYNEAEAKKMDQTILQLDKTRTPDSPDILWPTDDVLNECLNRPREDSVSSEVETYQLLGQNY